MYIKRETVTVTTAASNGGAGEGYSKPVNGRILSIQYVKTDFADTVDFVITLETTGRGLWTEENITGSAIKAPRQPAHDQVGAALVFDAANKPVPAYICADDERVKIAVTNGGDGKVGTFHITIG